MFWGAVDANVDWCEQNYVVSPYIAEYWNTLSSIPIIVYGIVGAVCTHRYASKERRYILAFIALAIVGLGSVAFHATLRKTAQFMDEVPMLWTSLSFMFNLWEYETVRPTRPYLLWLLPLIGVVVTFSYIVLHWYPLFLFAYTGLVGILFFRSAYLCFIIPSPRYIRWMFVSSAVCYVGGTVLWIIENAICDVVRPYYFHAIWHLGAGAGTYVWCLFTVSIRAKPAWRRESALHFWPTLVPHVRFLRAMEDGTAAGTMAKSDRSDAAAPLQNASHHSNGTSNGHSQGP